MDSVLLHLTLHHFPVVLCLAGALGVLGGMLLRRPSVTYGGVISLTLAGATAPAAYLSGRAAASRLLDALAEDGAAAAAVRATVDSHGSCALIATAFAMAAGVAAVAWLRGKRGRWLSASLLALSISAAGFTAAAAREGGRIRHGGPPSPSSLEGRLEHLDGRDVLVGLLTQVGEDVVQFHDHPQ